MATATNIDAGEIIDRQPVQACHYWIASLCAASVLMDGFDTQAIGFVAPALAEQWNIARPTLSPVLSSGLLGMLIGAPVFGSLGDRWGRKRVLIVCTLWFGIGSLLTASAGSVAAMLLLRLFTGFGLGGTLPNAAALTSEFMPARRRATGVTLMMVGFSIGGTLGGVVAAGLITRFGWQSVFIVGGIVPCLTAVFLFRLPESIRFLLLKGSREAEAARVLRRVVQDLPTASLLTFRSPIPAPPRLPLSELFRERRASTTLLIWSLFLLGLMDLYFLNGWLPTVIHDTGIALDQAIVVTTFFHGGGAVGAVAMGLLVDRLGSYRPLVWGYLGGAVLVTLIGLLGPSITVEAAALFAVGFGITGAHNAVYSLAAESYPTQLRATGVGWGVGVGRIGSILGPVLGGVLLSYNLGMRSIFWVAAVPPILAAMAAARCARLTEPRLTSPRPNGAVQ